MMNWWVGKNMLNTNIFMTNPNKPSEFEKISGDGLALCIWEGYSFREGYICRLVKRGSRKMRLQD